MDPDTSEAIVAELSCNWIWVPNWVDSVPPGEDHAGRLVHFKRTFVLSDIPTSVTLRLSADTRYKLLVNEKRICLGPSRGFDRQWYYDTIDIGPFLQHGVNVVDIFVLRFFPGVDAAVPFPRCRRPGLTVCGSIEGESLATGGESSKWLARIETHIKFPVDSFWDIFLNVFEDVSRRQVAGALPWLTPFDYHCRPFAGALNDWDLHPRMIPLPEETPCRLKCIRHSDSHATSEQWMEFFTSNQPLALQASSIHRIELEFEVHSTAYIRLSAKRPRLPGSRIRLTYSEAYETLPRERKAAPRKSDRTERQGHGLVGPSDTYLFSGMTDSLTPKETYEPFFWKTFRFIVLYVEVDAEPLYLTDVQFDQTNYPMDVVASWDVEDPVQDRFWELSIRTMRNCMFDGYNDCPFYEQQQYGEDSRSAMLFHYLLSGDDRLARQAIVAFGASLRPDGLLCGNYPSLTTQIIPGFSLFWILAVCDHMLYIGDTDFIGPHLATVEAVLNYYERQTDITTGLVSRFPSKYWSFIDWNRDWPGGHAPGDQPLSFFTMLYAMALQRAAILLRQMGRPGMVEEYLFRAKRSSNAVRVHCYDGQYFTDTTRKGTTRFSQVAQVFGVLCGAVHNRQTAKRILCAAFATGSDFSACSYPMIHYAFRALAAADVYDEHYHTMWEPWKKMLAKNLTTWEEDDVNGRSDCHEWSSLPVFEFLAEVVGLTPLEPGWRVVQFAPRVKLYRKLHAKLAMGNRGAAEIRWNQDAETEETVVQLKLPVKCRVIRRNGLEALDQGFVSDLQFTC